MPHQERVLLPHKPGTLASKAQTLDFRLRNPKQYSQLPASRAATTMVLHGKQGLLSKHGGAQQIVFGGANCSARLLG